MSLHAERAKCFSSTKATSFPSQVLKKIVLICKVYTVKEIKITQCNWFMKVTGG